MEDKYYDDLVTLRMERSEELLLEAKKLLSENSYKSANNRAYYAIEKALNALMTDKRIETKTHNGAMKMFNVEYVRVDKPYFTNDDYRLVVRAEQIRNASDYDDFYIASKEETKKQVEDAEYIVHKVRDYFTHKTNTNS